MVRSFKVRVDMPLAPAAFWAMRGDINFDHYCADLEKCTFTLLGLTNGTDAAGNETLEMESRMEAEESPLPSALQTMLGAKKFSVHTIARWCTQHYDEAHKATFDRMIFMTSSTDQVSKNRPSAPHRMVSPYSRLITSFLLKR